MHVASIHFKERAHDSLGNELLQQNLVKFKTKFVAARKASLVELDDFEGTRDAGMAIRQRGLDNLDTWIEIFEANATARGAKVLFAQTPEEVNRLVLDIASCHGVPGMCTVNSARSGCSSVTTYSPRPTDMARTSTATSRPACGRAALMAART